MEPFTLVELILTAFKYRDKFLFIDIYPDLWVLFL